MRNRGKDGGDKVQVVGSLYATNFEALIDRSVVENYRLVEAVALLWSSCKYLNGTAMGAAAGWRANLRIHVVAVGDAARSALQTHRVHGRDTRVGACFETVLQRGCATVAPTPDGSDVVTIASYSIDGAGKNAIPYEG